MTKSRGLALALVGFALLISVRLGSAAAIVADDVSGSWAFVLNTGGGDRPASATFKLDGQTVSGTWGEKDQVKGTFKDGMLDLSFPIVTPEAGEGTLKLKGKLNGDELTGDWEFQTYSGTFTAKRSK